jgi:hypothetical protein
VNPSGTKAKINRPRTYRGRPNGTSSRAVGGWRGPITSNNTNISDHHQRWNIITAAIAKPSTSVATGCARDRSRP